MDLIAVQPRMTLADYASFERFEAKLAALEVEIDRAREAAGGGVGPALVVFPEVIGSYLMLAGLRTHPDMTMNQAIIRATFRNLLAAIVAAFRYRLFSPTKAVGVTLAIRTRPLYLAAFGRLAARLGAHVVAGSALLPDLPIDAPPDARPATGNVFNTSVHFGPDGKPVAATQKVNLVPMLETGLGIAAGTPDLIPIVDVGPHRVATLVCYDGYRLAHSQTETGWQRVAPSAAGRGATILAQPASGPWPWNEAWVHDRERSDGLVRLRSEQWRQEGLYSQLGELEGVRFSVSAQLLGRFLGLNFEGKSEILMRAADGTVTVLAEAAHASAETVICASV